VVCVTTYYHQSGRSMNSETHNDVGEKYRSKGTGARMSQATVIADLFTADDQVALFHNGDGETFATIFVGDHQETWPTASRRFGGICNGCTSARHKRPRIECDCRGAGYAGDSGAVRGRAAGGLQSHSWRWHRRRLRGPLRRRWRVVEISASTGTFRVLDDSPVRFVRARECSRCRCPSMGATCSPCESS